MVIASNSILGAAALNSNSLFLFFHLGVKTRVLLVASALARWFFSVVIASNPTLTFFSVELFLHDSVLSVSSWLAPWVTTTCLLTFSHSCTSVSRWLDPWVAITTGLRKSRV